MPLINTDRKKICKLQIQTPPHHRIYVSKFTIELELGTSVSPPKIHLKCLWQFLEFAYRVEIFDGLQGPFLATSAFVSQPVLGAELQNSNRAMPICTATFFHEGKVLLNYTYYSLQPKVNHLSVVE